MKAKRNFDGMICFGGADYWYHNRGHYDLQMCRQFARQMPVLYVNSLGVRLPRLGEGSMFFKRVIRKLKSWRRGFVRIDDRFAVLSPISVPGKLGAAASSRVLLLQIRQAARRMGIRNPLIWVECPTAVTVLDRIPRAGMVYQRTDRYESFPDVNRELITARNRQLQSQADVTLFCSTLLYNEERSKCRRAAFIDHGLDFDRFFGAGGIAPGNENEPPDVHPIARPRVGYVGSMDPHTFDGQLVTQLAQRLPHVHFVLVGPSVMLDSPPPMPNVHRLGQKPFEEVAGYMAACDVLIMPWNRNEWIEACNPVKLKEYLAVGRPIISTPFDELKRYEGLVTVAEDTGSFIVALESALRNSASFDAGPGRQRVRHEAWSRKAATVLHELAATCEIEPSTSENFGTDLSLKSQAMRSEVVGITSVG